MICAWGARQTLGLVLCTLFIAGSFANQEYVAENMSKAEREELKNEAKDMFYHAYNAYMENAYPADELKPLSCAGRYRGAESSRGDIDDALGNFSLTLIDSLDTLVVLGDLDEFERAVKLVVRDVTFDTDIVVSVFETNIRVLGGLLSAHALAARLCTGWYHGQLLTLALDLGRRLLPAFNTTTGIPHARVNLRHGLRSPSLAGQRETCTACAGTMVLEMAALSRLSGNPVFELEAHRAMDGLWRLRHRSSELMGTVLDVDSGAWVRRDSGVGAGIDSYYEYCLKAYVLLGEDRYLGRFNKHYAAVMKYVSQGPMLLDVHMHRPRTNSRNFMDALLAFWPGLQVLKGDLRPAVETHEMLRQVAQRHNFIPEAFTTDFQVHWGAHPLRPEFLESTYFLYRATGDAHYLAVGRSALRALQRFARTPCGYAAVKDVRTGIQEDRMDSFVLAETFKYLYLLFAEPKELLVDPDEYVFTTEGHLLPLSLSRGGNTSRVTTLSEHGACEDSQHERSCPSAPLLPAQLRHSMRHLVSPRAGSSKMAAKRKMAAAQFLAGDPAHVALVNAMGISMATLPDGRVQLMHTLSSAATPRDGEEGLLFMQEMVELSKAQAAAPDAPPRTVSFTQTRDNDKEELVSLRAGPAHFGPALSGTFTVSGQMGVAEPFRACSDLVDPQRLIGRIAIVQRGDCMFVDKARRIALAGAVGGVVVDSGDSASAGGGATFAMSGDGVDDVTVPVVFLAAGDAQTLLEALERNPALKVTLSDLEQASKPAETEPSVSTLDRLKESILGLLSSKRSDEKTTETGPNAVPDAWLRLRQRLSWRLAHGRLPTPVAQLCRRLLADLDAAHRAGDVAAAAKHAAFLLAELGKLESATDQPECPTADTQFRADDEL